MSELARWEKIAMIAQELLKTAKVEIIRLQVAALPPQATAPPTPSAR